MLDFTSALYLGLSHGSRQMRPWTRLTTGRPAAMGEPLLASRVADGLAALIGCEAATLGTSTLHLYWDLFGLLRVQPIAIYLDEGSYPIARWGVERAAARGVPVRRFPRHDAQTLRRLIEADAPLGLTPVVVADGLSPAMGCPAPVVDYVRIINAHAGYLILDDTQALGILGRGPGPLAPYGCGGGGTLRWSGASGPQVVVIASLAKGFGAPIAVLAGSANLVQSFRALSATRRHCSPPSMASLLAAAHALEVNAAMGETLREQLVRGVRRFREALGGFGLTTSGGLFPVQTLTKPTGRAAVRLHDRLLSRGMRTVLQRANTADNACLSFILTARHQPREIELATRWVAEILNQRTTEVSNGTAIRV